MKRIAGRWNPFGSLYETLYIWSSCKKMSKCLVILGRAREKARHRYIQQYFWRWLQHCAWGTDALNGRCARLLSRFISPIHLSTALIWLDSFKVLFIHLILAALLMFGWLQILDILLFFSLSALMYVLCMECSIIHKKSPVESLQAHTKILVLLLQYTPCQWSINLVQFRQNKRRIFCRSFDSVMNLGISIGSFQ